MTKNDIFAPPYDILKPRYRLRFMGYHLLSGKAVWKCYIVWDGRLGRNLLEVEGVVL